MFERWLPLIRLTTLLVVALILIGSILTATRGAKGDIDVFIHAARLALEGGDFYEIPNRLGIFYLYPPLFALLCVPLTIINLDIAIILWSLASILLIGWTLTTFYRISAGHSLFALAVRRRWIIAVGSIMLIERFIETHLVLSQANILVLAGSVGGLALIARGTTAMGHAIMGISGVIKPISYPVGIPLMIRQPGKAVVGLLSGVLAGFLLPALFFGFGRNVELHREWFEKVVLARGLSASGWIDTFNLSLQAQMMRFFTNLPAFHYGTDRYVFTIWEAPSELLTAMNLLLTLAVPASVGYFAWRFRRGEERVALWGSVAFAFSLTPLATPIAQEHHFVLLLPACVYVVRFWVDEGTRDRWLTMLLAGAFLLTQMTSSKFWGDFLAEVFIATGVVTSGSLFVSAAVVRVAMLQSRSRSPTM